MESKKWYGLTIVKKAAKVNTKGKSVFESDDSDDNVEDHVRIKKEASSTSKEKKKVPPDSKPEVVDPSIYEYDNIYDQMKASQKQKTSHTKSKEPRYINLLLKAADRRKKEGERRVERKIQAERVKEGDTFKDKDAFVTSAYRKKMLEMEEEEERERREAALEEMMDSTKQKDLSGFYRHFLKQTVGEEKVPEFGERDAKLGDNIQKKQDYPEAEKSKQRSESPPETRTKHFSPEKRTSHSDIRQKTERSHRADSLNKFDAKDSQKNSSCDLDKSGHSKPESSSHRSKGRQQSCSLSDSEDRKSKSRLSKPKPSYRNQGRQQSYSSSDSEGRNNKSGCSKPKLSLHRSQGRQRSCSSSDSESRNSKPGHSKSKPSSHRSQGRQQSSSSDSESRDTKSRHSKSKASSHRKNGRQQNYSSDSEDKKGKHSADKSHKRKLDRVTDDSKPVHDEKQKYSHNMRNQEEKIHDRAKSDRCTTAKQTLPSEKHGSRHSSDKVIDQRFKHERDREEYKKDVRAHHRKEKESFQTSSKPTSGNHNFNEKNFDNKNEEYSKHGSNYNHSEDKKYSSSKRRESSISADYPESKRKKCDDDDDDDDDDDTSHTSSEEDEMKKPSSPRAEEDEMKKPSSPKAEEGKNPTKNPKVDMVTKFAKRTIGKVFDDAQARYFKRRDAAKAMN